MSNVDLNIGDDAELELDFNGIEDVDFTPIEVGKYLLKVIGVTTDKRTKAGDMIINIQFALADVPEDDPQASKKIFHALFCVPPKGDKKGSLWRVRKDLEAITGVEMGQGKLSFQPSALIGRRVWGKVTIESYQVPKDKTDANSEKVTRYKNVVDELEMDMDSIPSEAITVTGNMSL